MKATIAVFFAQVLNHTLWYLDVRAAHAERVRFAMTIDIVSSVLQLYTFGKVLEPNCPKKDKIAFIVGGALGTVLGVLFPL